MSQRSFSSRKRVVKKTVTLKDLVGAGDKIMLLTGPFMLVGLALNILFPAWFAVGGPPLWLKIVSGLLLVPGLILWLWSVYLVLTIVPRRKLITHGPYAWVKHPLYTSVALLVLPWAGFLLNSWLGLLLGAALYIASRLYSPLEDKTLAKTFGRQWEQYSRKVLIRWL